MEDFHQDKNPDFKGMVKLSNLTSFFFFIDWMRRVFSPLCQVDNFGHKLQLRRPEVSAQDIPWRMSHRRHISLLDFFQTSRCSDCKLLKMDTRPCIPDRHKTFCRPVRKGEIKDKATDNLQFHPILKYFNWDGEIKVLYITTGPFHPANIILLLLIVLILIWSELSEWRI